ncbi:MAG: peptide-methionine (S)-S-oxide reductase MsrA [Acidobacteriota bacterium]
MKRIKSSLLTSCKIAAFLPVLVVSSFAAEQKAVFSGGCFWGVEAVFEHVKGVVAVRSGYTGGTKETANYGDVSAGNTNHAESVEIRFDPARITYGQLLNIFFAVAHDPTEVNRQGPDTGTQYRSAIFYLNEKQKKAASAFMLSLNAAKAFDKPIATEVVPLTEFFEAEGHHQNYLKRNPGDQYIVYNDLPKLKDLKKKFPNLYRAIPAA